MTMKKLILGMLVLALTLALLSGCGSKKGESTPAAQDAQAQDTQAQDTQAQDAQAQDAQQEAAQEQDAQSEQTQEAEEPEEPAPAPGSVPYDWLGLQDMPKCPYLDQLATNHYIQVYDSYVQNIQTEVTEAIDGINAFQKNQGSLTYSVDGILYAIDENTKGYMQYAMNSTVEEAKAELAKAMNEGINTKGREFQGTGKQAIPLYADATGDSAEYEYYEYRIGSEELGSVQTERYYMKDGDVFAIYSKTQVRDSEAESTKVIKSISGDIPDGTFTLPNLSNYEKTN